MAAETIIVYIDPVQLAQQKNNKYNLFLAKKVNGAFTVIWQSFLPVAETGHPSYEYQNVFNIQVPNYEVNYGTVSEESGSVTFNAGGLAQSIELGQTVTLDQNGLFGEPSNDGTPGEITINNSLADNPHVELLDNAGNPIYVDVDSGMDKGPVTITPIDTYQIWFENYQDTGTIIVDQASNAKIVTFSGSTTSKTISYTKDGNWQDGPLSSSLVLSQVGDVTVEVVAAFQYALTVGAVTYLLNQLINKFAGNLRPSKIEATAGSFTARMTFNNPKNRKILSIFGTDKYLSVVGTALSAAKKDPNSGLDKETWTLSEPTLQVSYHN